jgi:hypothetical protein
VKQTSKSLLPLLLMRKPQSDFGKTEYLNDPKIDQVQADLQNAMQVNIAYRKAMLYVGFVDDVEGLMIASIPQNSIPDEVKN